MWWAPRPAKAERCLELQLHVRQAFDIRGRLRRDFAETQIAVECNGCVHGFRVGIETQARVATTASENNDLLDECLAELVAAEVRPDVQSLHLASPCKRKRT